MGCDGGSPFDWELDRSIGVPPKEVLPRHRVDVGRVLMPPAGVFRNISRYLSINVEKYLQLAVRFQFKGDPADLLPHHHNSITFSASVQSQNRQSQVKICETVYSLSEF